MLARLLNFKKAKKVSGPVRVRTISDAEEDAEEDADDGVEKTGDRQRGDKSMGGAARPGS
jgi:hypothetical protein